MNTTTSLSTFVVERPSLFVSALRWLVGLINPPWISWPGEGPTKEFLFQRIVLDEVFLLLVVPDEVFFLAISLVNFFFTLLLGWAFALLFNCTLLFSLGMVLRFVWFLDWFTFRLWSCVPGFDDLVTALEMATEFFREGIRVLVLYFPPLAAWRGFKRLTTALMSLLALVFREVHLFSVDLPHFVGHSRVFSDAHNQFLQAGGVAFSIGNCRRWEWMFNGWFVFGLFACFRAGVLFVPWFEHPQWAVLGLMNALCLVVFPWAWTVLSTLLCFGIAGPIWLRFELSCFAPFCLVLLFVGGWIDTVEKSSLDTLILGGDDNPQTVRSRKRLEAYARGMALARLEGTDFVSVSGAVATVPRLRPRGRVVAALESALGGRGAVGAALRGRWTPDLPSHRRGPAVNAVLAFSREGVKVLGVGATHSATGPKDYVLVETLAGERRVVFPELAARLHLYAALRPRDASLLQGVRSRAAAWFKDEDLPSWCVLSSFSSSVADALEVGSGEEEASRRLVELLPPTPSL
uniref:Uncharacterized protein n=1 Tax=Riboviria sp. TaxID=2585031 RepID=A0A514DAU1_9VIRU|nr:MAG: hypothetical protein H1BulkLitter5288_000002 [Riboviria sp.]